MSNRIQLNIAGFSLTVTTEEDAERVLSLADALEKDISTVIGGTSASTGKAAVVCALDYFDRLQKSEEASVHLRNQIRDYLGEAASAKLMIDEREKTIEHLNRQLAQSAPSEKAEALLSQLNEEKEKNVLLCRELDDVNGRLRELTHRLEASDKMLEDAAQKNDELEQLRLRVKELEESPDRQNETVSLINEASHDELQALRDDLEDLTEEADRLREENEQLTGQRDTLGLRARQAEEQAEVLRNQLETLESLIEEEGFALPSDEKPADTDESRSLDLETCKDCVKYIMAHPELGEEALWQDEDDTYDRDRAVAYIKELALLYRQEKTLTEGDDCDISSEISSGDLFPADDEDKQEPIQSSLFDSIGYGDSKDEAPLYGGIPAHMGEEYEKDIVETLPESPVKGFVFPDEDMPDLNWTEEVF